VIDDDDDDDDDALQNVNCFLPHKSQRTEAVRVASWEPPTGPQVDKRTHTQWQTKCTLLPAIIDPNFVCTMISIIFSKFINGGSSLS